MRTSRLAALAVTVTTLAACMTDRAPDPPATGGPARSQGGVLIASTGSGDLAIDATSGALLAGGAGALAAPGGDALYQTTNAGRSTSITSVDPRSGETMGTQQVRGELDVAVASVSGHAIALVEPVPGAAPGVPVPRTETTIVVADLVVGDEPIRFRLDGNYEPEAFSIDDGRLFMIQYLPAETPAVYRVVVLELASGEVRPVHGRFKTPPQRMPGVRLGQVFDPITSQMYTLYSNRPGTYANAYEDAGGTNPYGGASYGSGSGASSDSGDSEESRGVGEGSDASGYWPEETFVHVLNLRRGWAFCAGLPKVLWGGAAGDQAIAASPDGRSLYVVDARQGLVAVMDTETLDVERTGRVDLGTVDGRTSVAMAHDGGTLFVASAGDDRPLFAIDTASLTLADRWTAPGPISGLGMSLDGTALFAAVGGRIDVLDLGTGDAVASVPTPGFAPIVSLDPLPD
ncbi:MAG: YncE family protein [Actinomycetota bacterium]